MACPSPVCCICLLCRTLIPLEWEPAAPLRLKVPTAFWPPLHTRPGDELGDPLEPPIMIAVPRIALDHEAQARAWCIEVRGRRRREELETFPCANHVITYPRQELERPPAKFRLLDGYGRNVGTTTPPRSGLVQHSVSRTGISNIPDRGYPSIPVRGNQITESLSAASTAPSDDRGLHDAPASAGLRGTPR